jgi:hypothetical protein
MDKWKNVIYSLKVSRRVIYSFHWKQMRGEGDIRWMRGWMEEWKGLVNLV